jgi:hypothetical protein
MTTTFPRTTTLANAKMLDIEDFDAIFKGHSYSQAKTNDIETNKRSLGGKTFFERLLELLQIKCTCS